MYVFKTFSDIVFLHDEKLSHLYDLHSEFLEDPECFPHIGILEQRIARRKLLFRQHIALWDSCKRHKFDPDFLEAISN